MITKNYGHSRLEINEFLLEADVHSLMEHIDSIEQHIKATVPNEVLYQSNGELNTRTRWGAVLYHAQSLRVTIRAFI